MFILSKPLQVASIFLLAAGMICTPVQAEGAWKLRGEMTVTSDYIYRGFSQTGGEPALQLAFRVRHRSGFVGGLWGSNVDFAYDDHIDTPRRVELRGFVGYAHDLGEDWSADVVVVHHAYPGTGDVDGYTELNVSAMFRENFRGTVAYTDSFFGSGRSAAFAEVSGRYPLPLAGIDVTAGVGMADLDLEFEPRYAYGHVGLSRPFRNFGLDLGYYMSDAKPITPWGEAIDGTWVFSVSAWIP